jgi:hypothetical protein
MRRRPNNPGFVLLMALAILVIAGTILAASARRCCRRAIDAGSAQQDLQVHWGGLTLQAVCWGRHPPSSTSPCPSRSAGSRWAA